MKNAEACFFEKYQKQAPASSTLWDWKKKLLETGSLANKRPYPVRQLTASGEETTEKVSHLLKDPTISTRNLSIEVGVSQTTVYRILKREKMHPYKPLYSQLICDGDSDRRKQFCEVISAKFQHDPSLSR